MKPLLAEIFLWCLLTRKSAYMCVWALISLCVSLTLKNAHLLIRNGDSTDSLVSPLGFSSSLSPCRQVSKFRFL